YSTLVSWHSPKRIDFIRDALIPCGRRFIDRSGNLSWRRVEPGDPPQQTGERPRGTRFLIAFRARRLQEIGRSSRLCAPWDPVTLLAGKTFQAQTVAAQQKINEPCQEH